MASVPGTYTSLIRISAIPTLEIIRSERGLGRASTSKLLPALPPSTRRRKGFGRSSIPGVERQTRPLPNL